MPVRIFDKAEPAFNALSADLRESILAKAVKFLANPLLGTHFKGSLNCIHKLDLGRYRVLLKYYKNLNHADIVHVGPRKDIYREAGPMYASYQRSRE